MALLDNGAQINTIMPKYISDHSLQMGLITDLLGAKVACVGLGNAYTRPVGYVVIQVQVDRFQGYDEDQIALVIPDLSNFVDQIPVVLGTPTISWVINVMKEVQIDALAMPWVNARVAHLLSVCRMTTVEVGNGSGVQFKWLWQGNVHPKCRDCRCLFLPLSAVKVGRAYTGECINIKVQALQTEDDSLLQGLTVQNTYTELRQGSKKAVVVVRNSMAYLQTLQKKILVARAVAVHLVPEPPREAQLQEGVMSPRILLPPDWLSGKDMGNYLMNWIWVS